MNVLLEEMNQGQRIYSHIAKVIVGALKELEEPEEDNLCAVKRASILINSYVLKEIFF